MSLIQNAVWGGRSMPRQLLSTLKGLMLVRCTTSNRKQPHLKCLGTEVFQFSILEYLTTYNEILGEWDSNLNTKFIFVSCIPYTHPKVILYSVVSVSAF